MTPYEKLYAAGRLKEITHILDMLNQNWDVITLKKYLEREKETFEEMGVYK